MVHVCVNVHVVMYVCVQVLDLCVHAHRVCVLLSIDFYMWVF